MLHSLVIPVFNEAEGLPALFQRLDELFPRVSPLEFEVILVNDGSRDGSAEILDRYAARGKVHNYTAKVIHFSRNFGHQIAITAGLEWAQGETVTVIDADLQDPPELILEFLAKWREGFEVVYAVRRTRKGESWFKLFTAKVFYRLIRRLTRIDIPVDTGDFRLMDRKVVNAFNGLRERHRFVRGMVSWVGYRQTGILYDRAERNFGSTHYPFTKMLKFSLDGITSFSAVPLQLATYLGFLSAGFAILVAAWAVYVRFISGEAIQGWTSVMLAVLFLGGVQLICLGIFGEYLGRAYDEVKARPLYLVGRAVGFDRK